MRSNLLALAGFALAIQLPLCGEPTGTLTGVVRDPNGAVIPEATVIIQNWKLDKSNANRVIYVIDPVLLTDGKGEFSSRLKPGTYDVFISYPALSPFAKKIRIEADKETTLECELKFDALTDFAE